MYAFHKTESGFSQYLHNFISVFNNFLNNYKRLIRDYWCLETSVSMYVMSHRHYDDNYNSLRFTLHKLSIFENRPCRLHRWSTDTKNSVTYSLLFFKIITVTPGGNRTSSKVSGLKPAKSMPSIARTVSTPPSVPKSSSNVSCLSGVAGRRPSWMSPGKLHNTEHRQLPTLLVD